MKYSTQENYRDGTVEKTTVVIRRKDAGNYDALFIGMGENGTDEHGFNYSHITYYKHREEYPTIAAKLSSPYYKEV